LAAFVVFAAAPAQAATEFFTDRLGYGGTITRYANMQDATDMVNAIGVFTVPARVTASPFNTQSRDVRLHFIKDMTGKTDFNKFQMNFTYTTADNTNGKPKDDPTGNNFYSGLNNPNRTQVGRVQLFDDGGSTDTFFRADWGGFDGTHFTTLKLRVVGANADPVLDTARVWDGSTDVNNTNQIAGTMISYDLNITLSGLTGLLDTNTGLISADNHPTGVTGTFSGLFQNTGSDPARHGFYQFNLALNLDNWAFAQGNPNLNGNFFESFFISDAAPAGPAEPPDPTPPPILVPAPNAVALVFLGIAAFRSSRNSRRGQG
jgi:hypothetical protein